MTELSPFSLDSYAYHLPESLIAQVPVQPPESAKLMFIRSNDEVEHMTFSDLPEELAQNTLIFLNDTKVLPARITEKLTIDFREKTKLRDCEILYLNMVDGFDSRFEAMVYPGDSFPVGAIVTLGEYVFEVLEITYQGRIFGMKSENEVMNMLLEYGTYPTPPYIASSEEAQAQYQTVFAKEPGSLAAPTASLHFTHSLLGKCELTALAKIQYATLHVGIGTFKIINQDDIREHTMHAEILFVTSKIFEAIALAKIARNPILAVGTTMVRYLESLLYLWPQVASVCELSDATKQWWEDRSKEFILKNKTHFSGKEVVRARKSSFLGENILDVGTPRGGVNITAETSIFIYPGYQFGIVDEIVTNFHLPNSTLMPMISAFAGLEALKEYYEIAKRNEYRFYSFGDGMYIKKLPSRIARE